MQQDVHGLDTYGDWDSVREHCIFFSIHLEHVSVWEIVSIVSRIIIFVCLYYTFYLPYCIWLIQIITCDSTTTLINKV